MMSLTAVYQRITHFFIGNRFRQEITLVLLCKLALLLIIAKYLFNHPLTDHLTPPLLANHYLSSNQTPTPQPPHSPFS